MRKNIFRIILLFIFIPLAVLLLLPWAAQRQFRQAQKLKASYLWDKSRQKFQRAILLNPLDASLSAGYAEFLKGISPYRPQESLLEEAAAWYERALELDPLDAQYSLGLGEAELMLFVNSKERNSPLLPKALKHFRRALENDPHGFNVSYEIGYRLVGVWSDLTEEDKNLAVERLKFALAQYPWLHLYVYPWVWLNTRDFMVLKQIAPADLLAQQDLLSLLEANNLYQFRQQQVRTIETYRREQDPAAYEQGEKEKREGREVFKKDFLSLYPSSDVVTADRWRGRSSDGGHVYENGNMYWRGTMSAVLNMPQGAAALVIQAKGDPADDIYPYMVLALDGEETGEVFVDSREWKDYSFEIKSSGGPKLLSVTFCNDGGNAEKNEDRNLYIGEARIIQ